MSEKSKKIDLFCLPEPKLMSLKVLVDQKNKYIFCV